MSDLKVEEFLKNTNFVGGDLLWNTVPRHYCGDVTRTRHYGGGKITFHFSWAGARTQRGWSVRAVRKTTLHLNRDDIVTKEREGVFSVGGHKFYLKGYGDMHMKNLIPQDKHRYQ